MPFMDDLNPRARGQVRWYTDSAKTVVTWWGVPHYYSYGSHTFQVVLYSNGNFQFNYQTLSPDPPHRSGANPTVGVCERDNGYGGARDYTQFYFYGYWYGWREYGTRIRDRMSVATAPAVTTTIEVVDSDWARPTLAAGGGGIGRITVEVTGDNDAAISNWMLGGMDIAEMHMWTPDLPDTLAPGERHTFEFACHLAAGTPDNAMTGVDLLIEYNSESGDPLTHTLEIECKWKESGNDRSEYTHSQDSCRHIRALQYNIDAGFVEDNGEFANAVQCHLDEDYKAAKNWATTPSGGKGLGYWGLSPGQVQGNEGNGNGGLAGWERP
jgi:hypothetical protein